MCHVTCYGKIKFWYTQKSPLSLSTDNSQYNATNRSILGPFIPDLLTFKDVRQLRLRSAEITHLSHTHTGFPLL